MPAESSIHPTQPPPMANGRGTLPVMHVFQAAQRSISSLLDRRRTRRTQRPVQRPPYMVHPSAWADAGCRIGPGTKIWHFAHIMSQATIGAHCVLGQNVFVGNGVTVGNHVKIQNNVSLYTGVHLEDYVFCGPSCVFTNVTNPRSEIDRHQEFKQTIVKRGATLGANSTVVCGVTVGRYAFVAAGAVVNRDVPDYALMMGVPARIRGWVSRHGYRLPEPDENAVMVCVASGWRYQLEAPHVVRCLDWHEELPLPANSMNGAKILVDR